MTRRDFINQTLKGIGLFTILPPSTTYKRIWRAEKKCLFTAQFTFAMWKPNPEWVTAEFVLGAKANEFHALNPHGFWIEQVPKRFILNDSSIIQAGGPGA